MDGDSDHSLTDILPSIMSDDQRRDNFQLSTINRAVITGGPVVLVFDHKHDELSFHPFGSPTPTLPVEFSHSAGNYKMSWAGQS